jgi:hypothetical protein
VRQRFVYAIGGTLRFVPPMELLLSGVPTVPTVSIKTARGTDLPTPVTSAAAIVDPTSTTLAQAAAEEDLQLVLASVAGVAAGRRYMVTAADGERFTVEVAGVNPTTKAVLLYEHLSRNLAVGDTFQGVELSYVLSAAQAPDPISQGTLYRAIWAFQVAGAACTADQLYEVHKRRLAPTLTADQVERRLPAPWSELSDQGPRAIQRALDDAWDDVLDDLRARSFEPDKILDADRLRQTHRLATLAALATTWGKDWKEWGEARASEYRDELTAALASSDWYEALEDAVQESEEKKVLPTIVLTR